ncbi:MAG: hypothetical protein K940chlam2_01716 [Chlamydiae bacterium]|nr:hypothetical protein [Chlamydiota bacterium]
MKRRITQTSIEKVHAAATHIEGAERVMVEVAAEFLGVTSRRVRNYINPECRCVLKQRKKRISPPQPDPDCKRCKGTGRIPPTLRATRVGVILWIRVSDLFEYAREVERKTGRPRGKDSPNLPDG